MRVRFRNSDFVPMLMMLIVEMKMLMHNGFVSVRVAVSFANDDSDTGEHRSCANDIWPRRKLAEQ